MTTWDEGARAARKGMPLSANPWNAPGRNSRQMTVERKASEWDEGYKIAKESLQPPEYPKGDLRRMLMVLGAILDAGEASLVQIVARTGLDNKTVSDLITKAQEQGAVIVSKVGAKYSILELGPVFKVSGCKKALTGALNAL